MLVNVMIAVANVIITFDYRYACACCMNIQGGWTPLAVARRDGDSEVIAAFEVRLPFPVSM
jgi:hypothetical protein